MTTTATRGFRLVVDAANRGDGLYSVAVEETNGRSDNTRQVARIPAPRLTATGGALADALRTSGQPKTALRPTRSTPIPISEDAGVRLALAVNVLSGVTKPGRTSRLLDGISRLSDEECFYWYAHTIGADNEAVRRRRLKSLRIFLAEE